MEDKTILTSIISFIAGIILAFLIMPKPEEETVYKFESVTNTDTLIIEVKDTVYVPKMWIKSQFVRDTVLEEYKPTISLFSTTTPFEYGNTHVSGEVLGEVLKMSVTNDFKIPVVTNTVTNTETKTIIKKSKGLYLGATVNSLLQPGAAVAYLDNKYIFEYQYQPLQNINQIGVSKKLF